MFDEIDLPINFRLLGYRGAITTERNGYERHIGRHIGEGRHVRLPREQAASAMRLLVTGGAGYIGSHMVKALLRAGHAVVVLDDLSTGWRDAVPEGLLVEGSTGDAALLAALFGAQRFDAVMHFASSIQVGESMRDPEKYFRNNVTNTAVLLDAMRAAGVPRLVFSSSAAVYGAPLAPLIDESHPRRPLSPYGQSKDRAEQRIVEAQAAWGLRAVSLRYFNAAGADPDGELGERHEPETHLIPLALRVAAGCLPALTVHGLDYDTPDGSCVRDYVHVADLCDAHLRALAYLEGGGSSAAFNLGGGRGHSVLEVVAACERVAGRPIAVRHGQRREGDPAVLVASAQAARSALGWQPRYASLDSMVGHAWRWETGRS